MNAELLALQESAGIVFMGQPHADLQRTLGPDNRSLTVRAAYDAQPQLVTTSNSGIPAFLTTFFDPKNIEILVAPMKAVEIVGDEVKKGDWTTTTAMFLTVESTGQVASYGDYEESGSANANVNYPQRQAYHYQVITQWGELELERMGEGRIDWANAQTRASILTLNKFQNKSYFFGVAGLENYGITNDPNLLPAITPSIKAAGGTGWQNATANEILTDIQLMYEAMVTQTLGLVELDSKFTLAMSPGSEVWLTKTSDFNVNVADRIKKNFPNLVIKTAPEYATASGNLMQLIADDVEGQRTASCAFTEKLRAHPVVVGMSNFRQKKSQGTYGAIVFRPIFIVTMIGI